MAHKRPTYTADTRLAVYGTLAPGQANAHQLDGLSGNWRPGYLTGQLIEFSCGVDLGYPGLILDPKAVPIEVQIFESLDLPQHWARLDAFEGENYQRTVCLAQTESGEIAVSVYAVTSNII